MQGRAPVRSISQKAQHCGIVRVRHREDAMKKERERAHYAAHEVRRKDDTDESWKCTSDTPRRA